ncbi:hypothetical protein DVH24_026023 [Malus domestica]|uniref:Uncharacterized protein n=1 Tax=Malus domestica TaxID=3750 RepID=A0A498KHI6_MALDO|nr:hypothetical protein DVH24_026023 [Malus domestica]
MKDVKRCHTRVQIGCDDWNTTLEAQRCNKMQKTFNEIKDVAYDSDESPIDRNIENDIVSIPNPSQRILTPIALRRKQGVRRRKNSEKQKKPHGNNNRRGKKVKGHKYQCWSEGYNMIKYKKLPQLSGTKPEICMNGSILKQQSYN